MNGLVEPARGGRLASIEAITLEIHRLAVGETGTMTEFVSTRVR